MVVCYFTEKKSDPKESSVEIAETAMPITVKDKIYTIVDEMVTAKEVTNLRKATITNSDIEAVLTRNACEAN